MQRCAFHGTLGLCLLVMHAAFNVSKPVLRDVRNQAAIAAFMVANAHPAFPAYLVQPFFKVFETSFEFGIKRFLAELRRCTRLLFIDLRFLFFFQALLTHLVDRHAHWSLHVFLHWSQVRRSHRKRL